MKTLAFRHFLMTFLAFALLPAVCAAQDPDKVPLSEVFRAMEARYGIQIRVAEQLSPTRLYDPELELVAPLPVDVTLEEALEHAVIRNGLLYEKKDDHYWITGGKNPGLHLVEKRYTLPIGDTEAFIDALTTLVQEDSWEECGSGPGLYEYLPEGKTLVLWQTPEVLAEVDDFFAKFTGQYVLPLGREKLELLLRSELTLRFSEVPLCDVAAMLEKQLGVPVRVDEERIEEEFGMTVDEPFSSDSRDITLSSALRNILEPKDLDYTLDGDTLLITTRDHAKEKLDLRFYSRTFSLCNDETLIVGDGQVLRTLPWVTRICHVGGGLIGRNEVLSPGQAPPQPPVTELYRGPVKFEPVIDEYSFLGSLTDVCQKEEWEEYGNGKCQVSVLRGPKHEGGERFVMVLGSQRVHEEVKHFIDALAEKTPWETPAMTRAIAALAKPVTIQAGADGITLEEFFRQWETQTGAKLHINGEALEEAGVELSDRVYLNLVNARADFALSVLRSGFGPTILNESVWLINLDEQNIYAKAYPVKQHEADIGDWDSVIDMLTTSVAQDSWEDTGNGSAGITLMPDLNATGDSLNGLIITQTYAVHQEIDRLLRTYEDGKPVPPTDGEARVRDALATKVTLEYTDKLLTEIAAELQAKFGVTILVEEERFEEEYGVAVEEMKLSLRVKDISLENALELLCCQRSELRMAVKDEVIHLTTEERYDNRFLTTKMYPWKFYVPPQSDRRHYPQRYDSLEQLFGTGGTGGMMMPDFFQMQVSPKAQSANPGPPIDDQDTLLDLITKMIAPESWEETGCGLATICPFSQWIVVMQTKEAHREIQRLLRLLEGKPLQRTAAEMRIAQRMAEPVTWDIQDQPLADVAWMLTQQLGVNFVVDTATLSYYEFDAGEEFSLNPSVTLQVKDMPLAEALAKMLTPLEMGFTVKHDAVLLTVDQEAGGTRECRVYNIDKAAELGLSNDDVLEMVTRRLMLSDDEMEECAFIWPRGYIDWSYSRELDLERLFGGYSESGGWLVINQTPAVHAILHEYLKPLVGESQEHDSKMKFYETQQKWREERSYPPTSDIYFGLGFM